MYKTFTDSNLFEFWSYGENGLRLYYSVFKEREAAFSNVNLNLNYLNVQMLGMFLP